MVSWCSLLIFAASAAAASNVTQKTRAGQDQDSSGSGSEFFPTYSGFQPFAVNPQGLPTHDLTALQQTHVLGDYQHRFQSPRFGPPGNFQNQPLLFSQQTDFGEPQVQRPQLHQSIVPPPQGQPAPSPFPPNSQFRPQPPPPPPPPQRPLQNVDARPSFNDQRNFKFPGSSRETFNLADAVPQNPTSNQRYRQPVPKSPPPPPPPTLEQNSNNNIQPFHDLNVPVQNQQFFDNRPRDFQRNVNFFGNQQQQNTFDHTFRHQPTAPSNQFSTNQINPPVSPNLPFNGLRHPPASTIPLLDQRNKQVPLPTSPAGGLTFSDPNQYNPQQPSISRPIIQQQNIRNQPPKLQDFRNVPPPPPPPVLTQPSISYQQQPEESGQFNNFQQEQNFQQYNPGFENTFVDNTNNNYQASFGGAHRDPPVSFNPNRRPAFLPTQIPKTSGEVTGPDGQPRRPLLPLLPSDFNQYNDATAGPTRENNIGVQKSKEGKYIHKTTKLEYQPSLNDLPQAQEDEYRPSISTPKPVVKEITINLANSAKSDKSNKKEKEKTQEELINEQIHKLLQSQNLKINSEESANGGSSLPLPELPPHLKDKYQIKLVNSEFLSELNSKKKKKKEKVVSTPAPQPEEPPPLPELPDHIKKQYEVKLVRRDELFKQFKIGEGGKVVTNSDLVSTLPGGINGGNETTSVFLANGQQLEILNIPKNGRIPDSLAKGSSVETVTSSTTTTTTTSKPPNVLFEELAKGVLPPGANIELIRHKANGETEKVNDLAAAKKVTFVLLEEQPDGSVRVQGVKGNGENEKSEKETVQSLINKIKEGSLKLPPSEKSSILTNEIPSPTTVSYEKSYVTISPSTERNYEMYTTEATFQNTYRPTQYPFFVETTTTAPITETPDTTPFIPTLPTFLPSKKPKSKTRPANYLSTSFESYETSTFTSKRQKTPKRPQRRRPTTTTTTTTTTGRYEYDEEEYNQRSSNYNGEGPIPQDVIAEESNVKPSGSLVSILQEYGLYEMAKFLDQSGLDTILNETGPYTIFIPTDAAFTILQEQLGGSDKAEDKFRENPRLLSGLLLHHVVPGSFKLSDLQDEMTGVSLAGTQLRINTYNAERKEPIVTVNGAVVSASKRDIPVPQGLAHAVDRVLFPLPVGDLVQTLKGDRERRFTKFSKSIEASGLEDLLTGLKTYTVFAPTDAAFSALTDAELDKLLTRREAARTIVLRHIMPGTLYSAGMHFYQIKESMERGQRITIQKELGKVKANSIQVKTANIPATNGVVHIIDSLL